MASAVPGLALTAALATSLALPALVIVSREETTNRLATPPAESGAFVRGPSLGHPAGLPHVARRHAPPQLLFASSVPASRLIRPAAAPAAARRRVPEPGPLAHVPRPAAEPPVQATPAPAALAPAPPVPAAPVPQPAPPPAASPAPAQPASPPAAVPISAVPQIAAQSAKGRGRGHGKKHGQKSDPPGKAKTLIASIPEAADPPAPAQPTVPVPPPPSDDQQPVAVPAESSDQGDAPDEHRGRGHEKDKPGRKK